MQQYEYTVVPAPLRGEKAKGLKTTADRFAHTLTATLNAMAADGWEYVRAETLPAEERSGLTGRNTTWQNLLVFRRPMPGAAIAAAPSTAPSASASAPAAVAEPVTPPAPAPVPPAAPSPAPVAAPTPAPAPQPSVAASSGGPRFASPVRLNEGPRAPAPSSPQVPDPIAPSAGPRLGPAEK
ncbi:DUF4177 domain-containing protein [Paracoccus pacificus]|uniref:DUF4177 domain-containing protein n=1 Tax=Paracoccus pacificus TaxID=1463598 RepID=A0ABW4R5D9_9RHOB